MATESRAERRPRDAAITALTAPARPRQRDQLRFTPQPATQWFAPGVLAKAGLRVVLSGAFGEFLDKRELQASVEVEPLSHRLAEAEVWFDFVADTGDGFDATYTIAWLAGQRTLTPDGSPAALPRGSLLILGGDEVYPVGNADAYEHKFSGPWRASLPWTSKDSPDLYALGGNHDWYDGLTAFIRIFCQKKWVGGRQTRQTRSYFAIELPHRWWLWGIDIQLDSYIDEPQLRYFEDACQRMQPGDRVILCTATPSWIDVRKDPRGFKNLAYLENRLIKPRGARLMLSLSGDTHNYAHYVSADGEHKLHAGGGGAFLHPTHNLHASLDLPVDPANVHETRHYERTAVYPPTPASRRTALAAVFLPLRNPSFIAVPGLLYVLLGWSSQFSLRAFAVSSKIVPSSSIEHTAPHVGAGDFLLGLVRNPISVLVIVGFLLGLAAFAKPPYKWQGGKKLVSKAVMGVVHLGFQLTTMTLVGLLAVRVADGVFGKGLWFTITLLVVMGAVGGVIGGMVTGLYLGLATAIPGIEAHGNETFSSMRLTSYKNFLRLHLDGDGVLHVYPIGVDRAHTSWKLDPDNPDDEAAYLAPDRGDPACHLIEPPFTIDGRTTP